MVDHPILQPMLTEIRQLAGLGASDKKARAIYDWVVEHMEYKKVGSGWGNGDTFWACSQRYGNCTDFHALVISLARTEGIPARFEIGFPVPEDRELFYGTQPADRIHFTTGRDLTLGPDHRGPPLNFFIYPRVEIDGQPQEAPIETRFRYRNVSPSDDGTEQIRASTQ